MGTHQNHLTLFLSVMLTKVRVLFNLSYSLQESYPYIYLRVKFQEIPDFLKANFFLCGIAAHIHIKIAGQAWGLSLIKYQREIKQH